MNRITFIKRVLGLAGVAAVAPAILTRSESEGVDTSKYIIGCDPYEDGGNTIMAIIDKRDKEILYGTDFERAMIIKARSHGMTEKQAVHVGNIRWKGFRKVGKLKYFDNNGFEIQG